MDKVIKFMLKELKQEIEKLEVELIENVINEDEYDENFDIVYYDCIDDINRHIKKIKRLYR